MTMKSAVGKSAIGMLAATAVAAAGPACAQTSFQPNWASWGSANLGVNTLARQRAEIARQRGDDTSAANQRAARSPTSGRVVTTYRSDPAVTRQVVDRVSDFAARTAGPQQAQAMREAVDQRGLESMWSQLAGPHGFHRGDAADSLAAYWALNWSIANGRTADDRQMAGVRAQLHQLMPANPKFVALGDAGRQAMSETYMLNYIVQRDAYSEALQRGDRAMQQRLSDAAEARFQTEMHMDLRHVSLTDAGFVHQG